MPTGVEDSEASLSPTVIATSTAAPYPPMLKHASAEFEVHVTVPHGVLPRSTVGVKSSKAKLVPRMVRDATAVGAALSGTTAVKTGESNVNKAASVLTCASTVSVKYVLAEVSWWPYWHFTEVSDIH
jgi:hypothetical protein